MSQKTYYEVIEKRSILITKAIADTKKWCVAPDMWVLPDNRRSDQYWMLRFSRDHIDQLDDMLVHKFLVSFQLTNRVRWDKNQVALAIADLALRTVRDPINAVVELAEALRRSNERRTQQTSAASKIVMFAKPGAEVFIWDSLATRSVRARNWYRSGRRTARYSKSVFLDAGNRHNYREYHAACTRALLDERAQDDFKAAVAETDRFLREVGGPMAYRSLVPQTLWSGAFWIS